MTITREQRIAVLMSDGNLAVPGGRYGSDTESCVPVALALADILAQETGEPVTLYGDDYAMGLVVNSHDDVASLISEYLPHEQAVELIGEEAVEGSTQ